MASGRTGYWCHFFHLENLVQLFLLRILLTLDMLTKIPSCFNRWCRISAHCWRSLLNSRMRLIISGLSSSGWWNGREDLVGMTNRPCWPYSGLRCSQFKMVLCANPNLRAASRALLPCRTNSTAAMRTWGKFGLLEYAIYISFYIRGGHKVLNHDIILTNLRKHAIIGSEEKE